MAHAFEQADCCVIKVEQADKGKLCDAIDYFVRNSLNVKDLIIINKMGKVKIIEVKHILNGKYKIQLKGFLKQTQKRVRFLHTLNIPFI